jgi:hypothetical protein
MTNSGSFRISFKPNLRHAERDAALLEFFRQFASGLPQSLGHKWLYSERRANCSLQT